jgi:hypothetical protein
MDKLFLYTDLQAEVENASRLPIPSNTPESPSLPRYTALQNQRARGMEGNAESLALPFRGREGPRGEQAPPNLQSRGEHPQEADVRDDPGVGDKRAGPQGVAGPSAVQGRKLKEICR